MLLYEFFGGDADEQFIEVLSSGEHRSADTPFKLKAKAFMQGDSRFVEAVESNGSLLIAQFLKVIAENEKDRFRCIAFAAVLFGNIESIMEVTHSRVAVIRADVTDYLTFIILYDETPVLILLLAYRFSFGPALLSFLGTREGNEIEIS